MNKTRESRRALYLIAGLLLALVMVGIYLLSGNSVSVRQEGSVEEVYLPGYRLYSEKEERIRVDLYFPDQAFGLKEESREIYLSEDPVNRVRQVMVLLLRGPRGGGLLPSFPKGVGLRELYLYEGCAYVDLRVPLQAPLNAGCLMEYLSLKAIRQSLVANFPEVERVKVLLNGQEGETLFGHMDIRQEYSAY